MDTDGKHGYTGTKRLNALILAEQGAQIKTYICDYYYPASHTTHPAGPAVQHTVFTQAASLPRDLTVVTEFARFFFSSSQQLKCL